MYIRLHTYVFVKYAKPIMAIIITPDSTICNLFALAIRIEFFFHTLLCKYFEIKFLDKI